MLHLPPRTPDFNPVEQAWSSLKQLLRGIKARLIDQLQPAWALSIVTITLRDNSKWLDQLKIPSLNLPKTLSHDRRKPIT